MRAYHFGPFILDAQERRLVREGEPVSLTPKAFDLLVYLVEHQGHLVGKDQLMEAVWKNSYVEEGNLPRTIHVLRRVLGTGDNGAEYIETVPTKGYRFLARVTCSDGAPAPLELPIGSAPTGPETSRDAGRPVPRVLVASAIGLLILLLAGFAWRKLDSSEASRGLIPPTSSGAAYMQYQTGRLHMERQHRGDHAAALASFEKATELDPHFADAYAGKADAAIFLYWASGSHDDIARARIAVNKAIELDPRSSYARTLLCRIRSTYDWDFAGAEAECRRAVDLAPQNHEARKELAFLLNSIGRKDEALREMELAIALAPTSHNKRSRGVLLYYARRFDEAIAQFKQVEATDPEFSESNRWAARCFEQKKDYAQALEYIIKHRQAVGAKPEAIALLRRAFATGGWPEVLRALLAEGKPKANIEAAGTFAQLGEIDKGIEVLEAMIKERRVLIVHMESDPRLDPLRSDPRFEELARRVGLRRR